MRNALVALLVLGNLESNAATFVLRNMDGPDEGFNDRTAVAAQGGNPATTRGEARLSAVNEALRIWSGLINSDVPIIVAASFDPLECSATNGIILGQANATNAFRDFPNAHRPNTFYPSALTDALVGENFSERFPQSVGAADITTSFNSDYDVNPACGNRGFYYGYDHNEGTRVDFLGTALHEIGHGLGFGSGVNRTTGLAAVGTDGIERFRIYDYFVHDELRGTNWTTMTAADRIQLARSNGQLTWSGASVSARINRLADGVAASRRVRLYAPTVASNSSVSHWDTSMTPNGLMEPFTSSDRSSHTDLAICLLRDIGWQTTRCPDYANNSVPAVAPQIINTPEDTPVVVTVVAMDADQDPLSLLVTSAPSRGVISNAFVGASMSFSYTPNADFSGAEALSVTAHDGMSLSAPAALSINISPVNDPPVAAAGLGTSTQSGQSADITLSATDVDSTNLTYTVATNPVGGTVTIAGAVATYRANAGYSGTDSFTYTASDGSASSAPVLVTIAVTAPPNSTGGSGGGGGGGGGAFDILWTLALAMIHLSRRRDRSPAR